MTNYPVPYMLDYNSLENYSKFNETFVIDGTYCRCPGCNEIVRQDECNPRDPGVCSVSCGHIIRGLDPYGWSG